MAMRPYTGVLACVYEVGFTSNLPIIVRAYLMND